MRFDQPPVVRMFADEPPPQEWPAGMPAVDQVLRDGLDLDHPLTLFYGENGSGKSTVLEALAVAYGMSPEGGSTMAQHSTRPTESPLHTWVRLQRGLGAARWGFFLRAETMHGFYTYLEENPADRSPDPQFHELSHGESFLAMIEQRFRTPGLYCLDEPEAALSFSGQLALVGALQDLTRRRGQVVCASHSPLLAAIPGARLLEFGEWGIREVSYDELQVVDHWRRYLADPQAYLRHLE